MQWKKNPLHGDIEVLFQLFNTPGTEVAPGSNEVGENLEPDGITHTCTLDEFQGRTPNSEVQEFGVRP